MGDIIEFKPKHSERPKDCRILKVVKMPQRDNRLEISKEDEFVVIKKFRKKNRKNIPEAMDYLEDYTKKYKMSALAYKKLGQSYLYLGKLAEASHNFERALQLNPKDVSVYVQLAEHYFDESMGDKKFLAEAEKLIKAGLKQHPFHPKLYHQLARILWEIDEEKSAKYLEKARELAHNGKYRIGRADLINIELDRVEVCILKGEYEKILESTEALHRIGHIDDRTCIARANAFDILNQKDQAIVWYNEALKHCEEEYSDIFLDLAKVYVDQEEYELSKEYLEKAQNLLLKGCDKYYVLKDMIDVVNKLIRAERKREMTKKSPPMRKNIKVRE